MTATMTDRIASRAVEVRPLRALLTVLAAPFWALGFVVGVLFVAGAWAYAAVGIGVSDARRWRADVSSGAR